MVPEPATWPAEVGPPGRRPDHIMVPEPATWPAGGGPPRPQAGPNHGAGPATWPAEVGAPPGRRPDNHGAAASDRLASSPRPKSGGRPVGWVSDRWPRHDFGSWRRLGAMSLCSAARVGRRSAAAAWSGVLLRRALLALSWLLACRRAAGELRRLSDAALDELFEELWDLPAAHLSLQVRCRSSIRRRLPSSAMRSPRTIPTQSCSRQLSRSIETPIERARLARAAIIQAEAGTIDEQLANAALVDLGSDSRRLLRAGLLQAVAVRVGATRTPAGVLLAA